MSLLTAEFPSGLGRRRAKHKGILARFIEAVQISRTRKAQEVIASYRHLMPIELERYGNTLNARSEDRLPFGPG
jgi:hypothetical protein